LSRHHKIYPVQLDRVLFFSSLILHLGSVYTYILLVAGRERSSRVIEETR
jgi:hypothetical protein